MFELNTDERDYVSQLLKTAHDQMLHELHHTDTRSYEEGLKRRIEINEQITRKLGQLTASAPAQSR